MVLNNAGTGTNTISNSFIHDNKLYISVYITYGYWVFGISIFSVFRGVYSNVFRHTFLTHILNLSIFQIPFLTFHSGLLTTHSLPDTSHTRLDPLIHFLYPSLTVGSHSIPVLIRWFTFYIHLEPPIRILYPLLSVNSRS